MSIICLFILDFDTSSQSEMCWIIVSYLVNRSCYCSIIRFTIPTSKYRANWRNWSVSVKNVLTNLDFGNFYFPCRNILRSRDREVSWWNFLCVLISSETREWQDELLSHWSLKSRNGISFRGTYGFFFQQEWDIDLKKFDVHLHIPFAYLKKNKKLYYYSYLWARFFFFIVEG